MNDEKSKHLRESIQKKALVGLTRLNWTYFGANGWLIGRFQWSSKDDCFWFRADIVNLKHQGGGQKLMTGWHKHQGVSETPKNADVICEQPLTSVRLSCKLFSVLLDPSSQSSHIHRTLGNMESETADQPRVHHPQIIVIVLFTRLIIKTAQKCSW